MFEPYAQAIIARIAKTLDVPVAALMAVIEVESGGQLFAKVAGRQEPLIRFEGHYFDRFLSGQQREDARALKLASPVPGRIKNPRSQIGRWSLLNRAIVINRTAALSSCSWGVGQVMGSHWKWLGYGSIDALVVEARRGLEGQVSLMARYIDRAGLADALRELDWAKFARVYNGPSYRKHRYDDKMAASFARHASADSLPKAEEGGERLMFGSRGKPVSQLQTALRRQGYVIKVDGFFGLVTDRTVRQFQKDHHLTQTGIAGPTELWLLQTGGVKPGRAVLEKLAGLRQGLHLGRCRIGGFVKDLRHRLVRRTQPDASR